MRALKPMVTLLPALLAFAAPALADDLPPPTTTATTPVTTTEPIPDPVPVPPPRLTAALPAWRAPGVGVVLRGTAPPGSAVALKSGTRRLAASQASGSGRFELRFRAPRPGRYPLTLVSHGVAAQAGTLRTRNVVLEAVGDITFGEQVGSAIASYGAAYPWTVVGPTLRAADLAVGNLETSVSLRGAAAAKQYTFRGPPWALQPLRTVAGLDVVTLANNHAADFGPLALLDTIRSTRAAGIRTIGAGANAWLARRPAVLEAGGLRVAFLGYSDVNPLGFPATARAPGTARAESAAIAADVLAAHRIADVVVCFFHWGVELQPLPGRRQAGLAASCLDAGAKVVLGAHPHVLGPVSRPAASSLVAWTLGNFVFPSAGATARSAILRVELDRRGVRAARSIPVTAGVRPRLSG